MVEATCAGCGKTWKVPAAGKQYACRVCGGAVVAAAPAADVVAAGPAVAAASDPVVAAPPDPAMVGAPEEAPAAPHRGHLAHRRRSQVHEFRLKYAQREHKQRSQAAWRWMLWLGLLFIVMGAFAGFSTKKDADKALAVLAEHDPDETLQIPGRSRPVRVSELAAEVKSEALRVWVIHGVLAAAFIGLAFWGRKAPLPAAVTGLCLYLVIQVLNLIHDPTTLAQGLVFKVLFIGAMAKAISSAMSERALTKAAARAEPELEPAPAP